MHRIVGEALYRMEQMIEEQNAEILRPIRWPQAMGYSPWVEEVWVNYISNAIKYGGHPPRIELGANPQPNGQIRFWARDNGPGIPHEAQKRLFTPFTRLNQADIKGYGLGLSIVRRIVDRLGGTVGLESEPGQGSLFFFTLPKANEDDTP
jgi:signal transduction histidine kinase